MKNILTLLFVLFGGYSLHAQDTCYGLLRNDTLTIGNNLVERTFLWNGGNIITYRLTDKSNGKSWKNHSLTPDFRVTKNLPQPSNGSLKVVPVKETKIFPAYLKVEVSFSLEKLDIKRVYRIYDDCPAIACDTYLRGTVNSIFGGREVSAADRKNIEFAEDMKSKEVTAVLDQFHFQGQHWHARSVEFSDVTDWHNNLVFEKEIISYRKLGYRGNLLFAFNGEDNCGIFFLKEAPCSSVQLAYQGKDFLTDFGKFTVTGLGITEKDVTPDRWTKTYGCVLGIYGEDELSRLQALRSYQKNIRTYRADRDEMIMMNTWGDRSQDSKVNESFCLKELERAARLGITHFQIDDGWQIGKSPNSVVARGSFKNIWDNKDYWKPDPQKYPRGLHPIVKRGKELGIEIGLWFNPSIQNDFADWQKDAQALISLYREYGIKIFKIDGLTIPSKEAETNLHRLFNKVLEETDEEVIFNLDATASRRGGYHMFNEYGNIFLENRYTDWQNYYPYWTLRNLWMLSKYVPAEKLQIEFLNKWRNTDKYKGEVFAPENYSFEYLFATTLAGQPLAWMEGTNLPEEAFTLREHTEAYKKFQHDMHSGTILPIGDEPSGRSWTGFQSLKKDRGYLIVYRENHPEGTTEVDTWLPEGVTVRCIPLMGHGKAMTAVTGKKGRLEISLHQSMTMLSTSMKLKTNAKINNDMRTLFLLTTLLFIIPNMFGQKEYRLNSPDGKLEVTLYIGDRITYELTEEGHTLVAPSPLSVHLDNGTVWGNGSHLKRVSHRQANEVIPSPFYKRSEVKDVYNEMTLSFREHFNLIFRMYNEGMAYRFAATGNRPFKVTNEEAAFNFNKDYKSIVPYVKDGDKQPIEASSPTLLKTPIHI